MSSPIHIIGGGLSGSEAARQIASLGVPVVLHEMRPARRTGGAPDRRLGRAGLFQFAALRPHTRTMRSGSLHEEMRRPQFADDARPPDAHPGAGRQRARGRPRRLFGRDHGGDRKHPLIQIPREEITAPAADDWDSVIIATGPLTSPALADVHPRDDRRRWLAFFDAIAPIIHRESIDMNVAWFQSRYDKAGPGGSGADYINCPMDAWTVRGVRRRRCSPATRRNSTSGKSRRPISTAACRSR